MKNEDWVRIDDTNYAVSSYGRIKNIKYNRILFGYVSLRGYPQVELMINKKRKHYQVHRLVAKAFVPNPDNKPCVNHKNGNTCDNCMNNLEWCSEKENTIHAIQVLGVAPARRLSKILNDLLVENERLKNRIKELEMGLTQRVGGSDPS